MFTSYELDKLLHAPLADVALKMYPATFLRWLHAAGMGDLALANPDRLPQPPAAPRAAKPSVPKKDYLVALFVAVFERKEFAAALYARLPPVTQTVIAALTWERDTNLAELERAVGETIATLHPEEQRRYYEPFLIREEHGFAFLRRLREREWDYSPKPREPKKEDHALVLPEAMRRALHAFVPPPPDYELLPLEDVPAKLRRFDCAAKAVDDLRLVAEYIVQGHLRYTKSEQVSTACVSKLQELTGGPEFYKPAGQKDLDALRTRLLVSGVSFAGEKARENLLAGGDSALPLRELFMRAATNPAFLVEELLGHLGSARREGVPRGSEASAIAAFYAKFPTGKWVSWPNIRRYHLLRDLSPNLLIDRGAGIRVRLDRDEDTWSDSAYIGAGNEFSFIGEPLLKGFAFLLAAFGMAEIAFGLPLNDAWQRPGLTFLTPFDGLQFVRLTPLGEFVLGRRATFDLSAQAPARAAIALDGDRLLATCPSLDPLTALALNQFMEQLSPGLYRMTHKSLLGGCLSRKDLEARLRLFRRVVCARPPPVWERFFEQTLARITPLEPEPERVVLRINSDEALRHLFATDTVLRELALRVEGLRVAVNRCDLKKMAKRLEHLGYLCPLSTVS